MKHAKRLTCLILTLSLILCLAACGDNKSNSPSEEKSDITGKYYCVSIEVGGQIISESDAQAIGGTESTYLVLNPDGTATLCAVDNTTEMAYADGKIWPVSKEDEAVSFSVDGDTLIMFSEEMTVTFKK